MRAVFGVVGLLVVLAIVLFMAKKQLQAGERLSPAAGATSGTVPQQARQVEDRVRDDVQKALQQGADRAASEAD